jgi:ankyrin repeat protein
VKPLPLIQTARRTVAALCLLVTAGFSAEPVEQLAAAVEAGDLAAVRKLLDQGANPNARIPGSGLGYTPLFLSVQGKHSSITEALLKAGADPAIEDGNGDPVMVHAADQGREPHARLLIAHGTSIDSRSRSGITALMRGAPYEEAEDIQTKIDLGADVNLTDPEGNTALMMAAMPGNHAAVKVLLAAGADPNLRNKAGNTALMQILGTDPFVSENDELDEVVKLLLQSSADTNLRDAAGNSTLILAIKSGWIKPETIDLILAKKPDLGIRDDDGRDALFHACLQGERKSFIPKLLELGADIKTTDNDGNDLLMLAASDTDPVQVRDLLARGLSPKHKTKSGQTAVHRACLAGRWENDPAIADSLETQSVEVLKLLHQHGGSLTAADSEGDTPLHLAAMSGNSAAARFLLPHFSDPLLTNQLADPPLHLAAASGSNEILALLLPKHPDVDPRDADGLTPLMAAIAADHRESFLQLAKAGADVNATDRHGATALSNAVAAPDADKARFLLEHGADPKLIRNPGPELLRAARWFHESHITPEDYTFLVSLLADFTDDINRRDENGMTALTWVAASNNTEALSAILKHQPDLNARTPDGRTALMWAATSNAVQSMRSLRAAGADDTLRDSTGRSAGDWLAWANAAEPAIRQTKPADETPLIERLTRTWNTALQDYIRQGKWNGADRISGTSPLHLAAALGDNAAMLALIRLGAPPNHLIEDQSTPLMEATVNGHLGAVEFLLKNDADPALRDADQLRAIDHAVESAHPEIARLLLGQKKPLSPDESRLLSDLVHLGDERLLRDFLEAGASIPPRDKRTETDSPFETPSNRTESPLFAAAARPGPVILRVLCEFPAATGADDPGLLASALHRAAGAGRLANVRFLIEERNVPADSLLTDSFGGVTRVNPDDDDGKSIKPVDAFSPLSRNHAVEI